MKYLKWIGLPLLGLILIYLLLCFIGPKNMNTTRTANMAASPAQVYNMYNNLEKWGDWSPWQLKDTSMVMTYGDKREGIGASYKWTSDASGAGSMEIIESVKNQTMKAKMYFEDYDATSFAELNAVPSGNNTVVTWNMEDKEDLPFLVRGGMLITGQKGSLESDFDEGLNNLKKIVEERAQGMYNGFKINPVQMDEKHYVMNRQMVDMDNVTQYYASNLGALFGKIQQSGLEMAGKPCGLFFKWDPGSSQTDMAAAIPIADPQNIAGASALTLPAGNALQIDYYGDYENSIAAHIAMDDYLKDYGLLSNPPVIEEYVTDPSEEKDPSKWLTKITYYIAQ